MLNEDALKDSIRQLVAEIILEEAAESKAAEVHDIPTNSGAMPGAPAHPTTVAAAVSSETVEEVPDVTAISMEDTFWVPNAFDKEGYIKMKQFTSGRLGIWRAGPRPLSRAYVRCKADHAAAQNTVWTDVDEDFIKEIGLTALESRSVDKAEYIKIPTTGKRLSEESAERVKKNPETGTQVQIVFSDGLSSGAIERNAHDILQSLRQGLKSLNISCADTVFFIKNGRVAVSDEVGELTGAEVIIMLTGERPGLNSQSSMGAYIAYKPTIGMEESRRTVISNIHAKGTPPVEAGAQIAELAQSMLKHKMSGVDLKLV